MIAPERAAILKGELRAAVESARALNGAVRSLAEIFRSEYPDLIRLAVRSYDIDENTVRIEAVWSAANTVIGPGFTMAATATSMPEVARTGRPVFEQDARANYLEDVLRSEGIRSWVSIPLRSGGAVRGMLSLSSRRTSAFRPEDENFLVEAAGVLEGKIFDLLADRAT
jgi:GAF domain-containing protein